MAMKQGFKSLLPPPFFLNPNSLAAIILMTPVANATTASSLPSLPKRSPKTNTFGGFYGVIGGDFHALVAGGFDRAGFYERINEFTSKFVGHWEPFGR